MSATVRAEWIEYASDGITISKVYHARDDFEISSKTRLGQPEEVTDNPMNVIFSCLDGAVLIKWGVEPEVAGSNGYRLGAGESILLTLQQGEDVSIVNTVVYPLSP